MGDEIIDLHDWLQTPCGQYLLAWEMQQAQALVADVFGYHALQLGLPELDALEANRMPHRWLATEYMAPVQGPAWARLGLLSDFTALPFAANSLDLLVLPHTLEFSADPHATLREVERVLVPEGRVLVFGLNPTGLWALRQWRARLAGKLGWGRLFLPQEGEFIGARRLQDWLHLLSFEMEQTSFGCFVPAVRTEQWLQRWLWLDRYGPRLWPVLGSAYSVLAVKRVRGIHLLGPVWKKQRQSARRAVPVARHAPGVHRNQTKEG
ncbi:methyltransferase domain-containing protein [Curvibacter sp. APW13]|uniref:class I SAM-dependent methyltransferase n=1 Tax=Curvibacter sp. APW13 TaxID=3077236 RepID=UPI0028DD9092|nr:methyltransferase domain-containing protein [Curvibacter sp. APW13]MDT8992227.1 methyltransferase domain-containing protein [Curvibacter sp. APW13]